MLTPAITLAIFGLGGPEIALIIFLLIMLFGAKKIPELARGFGKGIREFKDATSGAREELENQINNTATPTTEKVADNSINTAK